MIRNPKARFLVLAGLSVALSVLPDFSQDLSPSGPKAVPQSGMASGAAHAPVTDAQHRPITAGGFVDAAPIVFIDVTRPAGLDKFHHRFGNPDKTTIIETPGSGVALIDYDNDGWLDIYLVNGA